MTFSEARLTWTKPAGRSCPLLTVTVRLATAEAVAVLEIPLAVAGDILSTQATFNDGEGRF